MSALREKPAGHARAGGEGGGEGGGLGDGGGGNDLERGYRTFTWAIMASTLGFKQLVHCS